MCKAWPGLRCQDHSSQKIRKYSAQIHKLENDLSELDESIHTLTVEHGPGFVDTPEHETLMGRREKLLEKITDTQTRKDTEICNYAMSAAGRKQLKELVENSDTPATTKLNAATELAQAEARVETQKTIGKVLKDETLTPEEKDAFLALQEELQTKKLKKLKTRQKELEKEIARAKKSLEKSKKAGNASQTEKYSRLHAKKVAEHQLVSKGIRQRQAMKDEIRKAREKYRKRFQAKFNKITGKVFKVVDFILQPNRKPAW